MTVVTTFEQLYNTSIDSTHLAVSLYNYWQPLIAIKKFKGRTIWRGCPQAPRLVPHACRHTSGCQGLSALFLPKAEAPCTMR